MNVFDVLIEKGVLGFQQLEWDVKMTFWTEVAGGVTRPVLRKLVDEQMQAPEGTVIDIPDEIINNAIAHYNECHGDGTWDSSSNPDVVPMVIKSFIRKMINFQDPDTAFENLKEDVLKLLSENRESTT